MFAIKIYISFFLSSNAAWIGVKTPVLSDYCKNRGDYIADIMRAFGTTRDIAKNFYIIQMFGGDISTWMNKHKLLDKSKVTEKMTQFHGDIVAVVKKLTNMPVFAPYLQVQIQIKKKYYSRAMYGALGVFLQDLESKCISVLYDTLVKEGFTIASLNHDAINVCKSSKMDSSVKTLCEDMIFNKLGLKIPLAFKSTTPTDDDWKWFENHKPFSTYIEGVPKGLHNDQQSARKALDLFADKVYRTDRGLMVYDDSDGCWYNDEKDHFRIMENVSEKWIVIGSPADCNKSFNSHFRDAYKIMKCKAPEIEGASWSNHVFDVGFLLYKNGVLNMTTKELLPFDPKYRFSVRIPRNYNTPDDYTDLMKNEIVERLFDMPITDLEKRDYMLEKLARGFAGCSAMVDRQFQYFIGETACGKGKITQLCKTAFGNFVEFFNADDLLVTSGNSGESAKDRKWILDICDARMAVSNEITMKTQSNVGKFGVKKSIVGIDGEVLKMLCSGGDTVKARLLYGHDQKVINKSNICIFVNDVPQIVNLSDAYMNRANYIQFDRNSSRDIAEANNEQFPADESIDDFVRDPDVGNAFVDLMCDYYKKSLNGLMKRPESVKHVGEEFSGASEASDSWITKNYRIYKNIEGLFDKKTGCVDWMKADGWYIQFNTLYDMYMSSGASCSKTAFGIMLKRVGLSRGDKKIKGKSVRVVVGIRNPSVNTYEDED